MLIKVILLVAIAAVVTLWLRTPGGARHLALRRIAIALFTVLAVLSVLFPDTWNDAAELVGVGRGTDLLLYGFIVVFLASMVTTYRRFRDTEMRLTLLARRIAIDEALNSRELRPIATADPSQDPTATPAADPPEDS